MLEYSPQFQTSSIRVEDAAKYIMIDELKTQSELGILSSKNAHQRPYKVYNFDQHKTQSGLGPNYLLLEISKS